MLSGQKLEFPTAIAGKPAVCIFGFSKEAGDKTKVWMTRLSQDGINAWTIADLEGAPTLVRPMIRSSMRKATPKALLDRSLILTKDEKAWKDAVGAKQDNVPVVVLFDAAGKVQWTYDGLFTDEAYRNLKTKLDGGSK
jgi:predicted transcriptional regulator